MYRQKTKKKALCIITNSSQESFDLRISAAAPNENSFLILLEASLKPNGSVPFYAGVNDNITINTTFGQFLVKWQNNNIVITPNDGTRQEYSYTPIDNIDVVLRCFIWSTSSKDFSVSSNPIRDIIPEPFMKYVEDTPLTIFAIDTSFENMDHFVCDDAVFFSQGGTITMRDGCEVQVSKSANKLILNYPPYNDWPKAKVVCSSAPVRSAGEWQLVYNGKYSI